MVLGGSDAISSFLVSIQVSYKYIFLLFVRFYYNYIPWLGLFFFFFVNSTKVRVMWEEETSTEKMSRSDCPVGKSVEYFLD